MLFRLTHLAGLRDFDGGDRVAGLGATIDPDYISTYKPVTLCPAPSGSMLLPSRH